MVRVVVMNVNHWAYCKLIQTVMTRRAWLTLASKMAPRLP